MALECNFAALSKLDASDPVAIADLLDRCTAMLLDPVLWSWLIGITVASGVVGALIGWIKGRWLAGLVWGLVLGPIGWLVVALLPSGMQECPECGRRNQPGAKVCRHCGLHFDTFAQQTQRSRLRAHDTRRGW